MATLSVSREWIDLSSAQQAVWLDASLTGSSDYQLGRWAHLSADINVELVRQAVSLIMARHDAFRLRVDDELPRQWLDPSVQPPLTVIDLSNEPDPAAAFHRHMAQTFATPMPLGDHPLFRVELIQTGPTDWYFLLRFHHLIADSAAVSIALHHWAEAYGALTGETSQELAPPSSYVATIAADRAYLDSGRYQQDLAYWVARFDPLPPPLLPDLGFAVSQEAQHATPVTWMLDGDAYAKFLSSAEAANANGPRAAFALLLVVLARRYGQTDVVAGLALHRRDLSNRNVVGMLAGVIPVRVEIEGRASLREIVKRLSVQIDEDLRHQRMPIDALSRAIGLSGSGRSGMFEVAMSYMPAVRDQSESTLHHVTAGVVQTQEASPISFHVSDLEPGPGLSLHLSVNPRFLDPSEAQKLQALLENAIDAFVTRPRSSIEDIVAVTLSEREQVVEEWNQTEATYPTGTLPALFEAQAARTPDALAVLCEDVSLTYEQLNAQANTLAHRLIAQGVGPERVVAVALERSALTVVSLLAILKAGGVYLPLDVTYPDERLAYMADDARAVLVITQASVADRLPPSLKSLLLDEVQESWPDENPTEVQRGNLTPDNLAYLIYTSGTTGRPKGVAMTHAPAVNLAFARQVHDPLGPGDRVLAAISVGFDVSLGQLVLPLLCGAAVVVIGEVRTLSASEYWQTLVRQGVTHVNSVPSFFESVLDAAPAGTRLRRLMLGGEALSGTLAARISASLSGTPVVNMYGPTEACIDATCHPATAAEASASVLPIGRPLGNYRAYILDSRLDPVGVGASGDLYLGGAGLARGYVGQPGLTAARFIADPFSGVGDRLYQTGDRARWRADGEIEFLGRADTQVKVRGHRIELGEIEAQLVRLDGVREAAVLALGDTAGDARLVAYYTGESALPVAALRAHLSASLPDYMVPSAYVLLDTLPLTPNGKLDRAALPVDEGRDSTAEYEPPSSPTELKMQKIWQDLLGIEPIGVRDDFFQIGGDSLTAIRLVTLCNTEFQSQLRVRSLFEDPTIRALALAIPRTAGAGNETLLVPLQTQGSKPALFCIHPAGGHVLCYLPLVKQLGTDQPVFGLQARGVEDDLPLASSIEKMAADYVEAIKTVQPEGPYQLLGMSSGGLIAYEIAQQLQKMGDKISVLVMLDTTVPDAISKEVFDDRMLVRAMANELGCDDLLDTAPPSLTLAELVEMARLANRLPEDFSLVQAEKIAGVFRNIVDLHARYRPAEWSGPLLLIRALRRMHAGDQPPDWSAYLTGSHTQIDIECGHNELVSSALAPAIARYVAPLLASGDTQSNNRGN